MKTTLIETDDLDSENKYYLYEVETETQHYYIATSDEEIEKNHGNISFVNEYRMLKREEFTDRQWEIAKNLFMFLWDSSNGTNTCVDSEIYEEDGFTKEEMEEFVEWFNAKQKNEVLDYYYEDTYGVEIYWDFFSCFDMNSCNPWEDRETKSSERYLLVFDKDTLDMSTHLTWCSTLEDAKKYLKIYNDNKQVVQENGRIHIELETTTRKIIH